MKPIVKRLMRRERARRRKELFKQELERLEALRKRK